MSTPGVDVGLLIRPCKDMEALQIYEFKRSYRVGVDIDLVFHFRGIELVNSLLKYALESLASWKANHCSNLYPLSLVFRKLPRKES